jgi:hypothetical protein
MAVSGDAGWHDPRRAAIWVQERRLLKASALYADRMLQFDSSPTWTNALATDVGLELRGKAASLTKPAYETVGVAADAARAYWADLASAAAKGLFVGMGWSGGDEALHQRQAALLQRHDTVPVLPLPESRVQTAQAWESALAVNLLGSIEGFPEADMDVVLDVRERITGSRAAFRAAIAQVAKELAETGDELTGPNVDAALRDLRVRVVDPALAELRNELDALGARRWLLRLTSDDSLVGSLTALTLTAAAALSAGPLTSLLAALGAAAATAGAAEANFRAELRGELRNKPMLVLHETGDEFSRQR